MSDPNEHVPTAHRGNPNAPKRTTETPQFTDDEVTAVDPENEQDTEGVWAQDD